MDTYSVQSGQTQPTLSHLKTSPLFYAVGPFDVVMNRIQMRSLTLAIPSLGIYLKEMIQKGKCVDSKHLFQFHIIYDKLLAKMGENQNIWQKNNVWIDLIYNSIHWGMVLVLKS